MLKNREGTGCNIIFSVILMKKLINYSNIKYQSPTLS